MRPRLLVPLAVFSGALVVYLLTMPPGLTWAHDSADGGDLIAAAASGGVPHPSGYPTYMLLATPLARLPWQNPAWRVTLLSALSGAAAAAFAAATVQRVWTPRGDAALPALAAGFSLAFSTALWAQSTVAEVYALHACLAAALLWIAVCCHESAAPGWPAAAGLLFGLALGNHLTSLWLAPLLLAAILARRERRARAAAAALVGLLAGLSVYLLLPLRAAGGSPVNWGDASTPAGFWWLVSGQLYRGFVFAAPLPALPGRVAAAAGLLWQSFLPWGVVLAAVGALRWPRSLRAVNRAMLASAGLGLIWALGYNTSDSHLTWLSAWPLAAVWLGVGLAELMDWRGAALALLAAALIVVPLAVNWRANDLSRDRGAQEFVAGVLSAVEEDAVIVAAGDRATFALWYARYGAGQRPDLLPVSRDLWALPAYQDGVIAAEPWLADLSSDRSVDALISRARAAGRPVYAVQAGAAPLQLPAPATDWESLPAPLDSDGQPRWQLFRLRASP